MTASMYKNTTNTNLPFIVKRIDLLSSNSILTKRKNTPTIASGSITKESSKLNTTFNFLWFVNY